MRKLGHRLNEIRNSKREIVIKLVFGENLSELNLNKEKR